MKPVSIVITTHRGECYLGEALESVLAQLQAPWEAIVVDDHPNSAAEPLVRAFTGRAGGRRVKYLGPADARSPAAARNRGIVAADGDLIAFLDEDDIWEGDHLQAAISTLDRCQADLAFSAVEMFEDRTGRGLGVWGPTPEERSSFPIGLYLRNYIAVLSVVMRRRVVDLHGVFDPNPQLRYGEDHDYWVRLAFAGIRFAEVDGIHGRYRKGHASGTADVRGQQAVHARVYRRHLAAALNVAKDRDHIRATIAARHAELATSSLRNGCWAALPEALWALRLSPNRARVLRSGLRRARSVLSPPRQTLS